MPIPIERLAQLTAAGLDYRKALQRLIQAIYTAREQYISGIDTADKLFDGLIMSANESYLLEDLESTAILYREENNVGRYSPKPMLAKRRERNKKALLSGRQPTQPSHGDPYRPARNIMSHDGLSPSERAVREQLRREAAEPPTIMPTDPEELAHMVEVLRKTEELERGEKEIDFDIPKDC